MLMTFIFTWLVLFLFQSIVPPARLPELISFLLGAFATVIVQFVKGKFQSTTTRFIIAVLLSVLVGVISYFLAKPEETSLVVFVVHVFAYSQIVYNAFWKIIWEEVFKFRTLGQYKG